MKKRNRAHLKLKIVQKQKLLTKLRVVIIAVSILPIVTAIFIIGGSSMPSETFAVSGNNSGRCLTFNGSNTSVDIGSVNFGLSSSNTMSISAWIKWNSKTGIGSWANIATLNSSVNNGDAGQFWLQHDATNNYFEFAVQTTVNRKFVTATSVCNPGTWYFVTGVYDGSALKMYVNGKLQASTSQTGNIAAFISDYKMTIGKWAYTGRYFNGDIDEVSLWNSALTQTQIRDMMCRKLSSKETGLIGYWRMNEKSGNSITDNSGLGHNGALYNAVRNYSGAPVGDTAIYTYSTSQLTFINSKGDSLKINNFSSVPQGIYLYRVDTSALNSSVAADFTNIGSSYYYGIFIPDYNNETYNVTYYFKGYPGINDKSQIALAGRISNADPSWTNTLSVLDTSLSKLTKSLSGNSHEIIPASKSLVNALPVELISFNAYPDKNSVKLKWKTASEKNNDHFSIKRSADGRGFTEIQRINGAGNSSSALSYEISDEHPFSGTSYYQLSQTDFDGKSETFNVISVHMENEDQQSLVKHINAFPNPFINYIKLQIYAEHQGSVMMDIYSMNGEKMRSEKLETESGINNTEISSLEKLSPGIYTLIITDENNHHDKIKIMKKAL